MCVQTKKLLKIQTPKRIQKMIVVIVVRELARTGIRCSNLQSLRDFNNYSQLTQDETDELIFLSTLLSPTLLIYKCFFQDDDMCGNLSGKFYKINAIQDRMVVASDIVIGGKQDLSQQK
ncbi:hypothetical protein KUTeg_012108, partial [Tegillarca granosa]